MLTKSSPLRRFLLVGTAAAAIAGAAVVPTIAQDAAPATAAPAQRPALAQLDGELRALYRDVEAGIVRVHLPAPALARLFGPDVEGLRQHPLRKWEPWLDDDVRRLLPRDRDGRPRMRFELRREDDGGGADAGAASTGPTERVNATTQPGQQQQQQQQGERDMALEADRAVVRALEDPDGLTMMMLPDGAADDEFVAFVYDDQGHVVLPTYVDKRALGNRPVRVTAGDRQVDATFVGADRQTNLTVLKLDQPTGTPLTLGDEKPPLGSLVLVLGPHRRSVDLAVWSGARDASGIVVTAADARVAGVVRSGQMLSGDAVRPVVDQLIKSGSVKRAKLGAMIFDVAADDPIREHVPQLGARPAVRIVKVLPNSAAAAAGLRPNDLILSLAGEAVNDIPSFAAAISGQHGPTELKIIREGREQTVTVELKPE
jgi:S1-C subfamily serine protease